MARGADALAGGLLRSCSASCFEPCPGGFRLLVGVPLWGPERRPPGIGSRAAGEQDAGWLECLLGACSGPVGVLFAAAGSGATAPWRSLRSLTPRLHRDKPRGSGLR